MPRPWTTRSDDELLAAMGEDRDAFEELYRRYESVVTTYLVRRSRDAALAADLTIETFSLALLHATAFRGDGDVAAWILGIARNTLLESWRRGRAERRARDRLAIQTHITDESLERVEALADIAAAQPRLERALARLPRDQREAITAHVVHDHPYPAIAAELGLPEATVRQRVSRGLSRLRSTLEGPNS